MNLLLIDRTGTSDYQLSTKRPETRHNTKQHNTLLTHYILRFYHCRSETRLVSRPKHQTVDTSAV